MQARVPINTKWAHSEWSLSNTQQVFVKTSDAQSPKLRVFALKTNAENFSSHHPVDAIVQL